MAAVETRSQVRAEARYVRAAPRKAQLIVDQIRGRSVPEARTILAFMTRDAANDVRKVLDSAAANAEANHGLMADELYVVSAFVGAGPTLKRWRARARGRVGRVKKRTCHITIALALPTGEEIPAPIERPAPVTLTEEPEPIIVDETGAVVEEEAPSRGGSCRGEAEADARPHEGGGAGDRRRGGRARGRGRGGSGRGEAEAQAHARGQAEGRRRGDRGAEGSRQAEEPEEAGRRGRDTRDGRGERELVGQKIHPGGLRVGVIHDWKSNWYTGSKEFPAYIIEDVKIREHIYGKLGHAGLSDILIRKDKQRITIDIYTARPGIVIGKSGAEVDALRREIHGMTHKNVQININEIKRPELDAKLVAQSIAEQLQNRVSFRRAMKRSLASAIRSGAKGVKITCGGRLGGAEMSRSETYSEGRVPLHTLRADIDYGFAEAKTTYGRIGVKVWINKGEIMPEGFDSGERGAGGRLGEQDQARRRGGRRDGLGPVGGQGGRRGGGDREGLGPVGRPRRGQRRRSESRDQQQQQQAPAEETQEQPQAEAAPPEPEAQAPTRPRGAGPEPAAPETPPVEDGSES